MLDTGSGPNVIKEKFVPDSTIINHDNILKLNGINDYPVYTLGEITLIIFKLPVKFHIVPDEFPISQSGILGNDFFNQTSSKIDYADGHLNVAGINVPFSSPESIIIPPRSKSLFYIRVKNPEIDVGYIPRIKLMQGVYSEDAIVENVSGKAFLNVTSNLDEEVKVRVPTLHLRPLSEMLDNNTVELTTISDESEKSDLKQNEIKHFDTGSENDIDNNELTKILEDGIKGRTNDEAQNKTKNEHKTIEIGNKNVQKLKIKNKNNNNEGKNRAPLKNSEVIRDKNLKTSPEIIRSSKTINTESGNPRSLRTSPLNPEDRREGNFQTSPPKNPLSDSATLDRGSSRTSSSKIIPEGGSYQTSPKNSNSVECEEGSYQTSLCNSALILKNFKERSISSFLENSKFPRVGTLTNKEDNNNES